MKSLLLIITTLLYLHLNAQSWQDVGGGTNNSSHGMLEWDGKLVNLGSFNSPCSRVGLWDGTSWSCITTTMGQVARAGVVWNGKLVVVGDFWNTQQPCVGCNGVAMWDDVNSIWVPLGNGVNNDVLSCTVFNGDLIIGGDFTEASGVPSSRVVRYNDVLDVWESMGTTTDFDNDVRCMAVFQGELWVGGDFNNVGGNPPSDGLVKWDASTSTWVGGNSGVDLVGGVNETVRVLYVNPNDGNLYMGGEFPELVDGNAGVVDYNMSGIAMYDGSDWTSLGSGLNEYCRAIHEYNGNLIAGGYFTTAGGVPAQKIAKWNGSTWSAMGGGFDGVGVDEYVKSAWTWNGIFFAGGAYTQAEGGPMNFIAQWYEAPTNPPTSVINSSATSECAGGCINFSDNSTNSPTSWTWSFPGASTTSSSVQNPGSICYPTAGNYTVELIACNTNGCDTSTMNITIGTVPTLSVNSPTICSGASATLTATPSSGGGDYLWSPGGETTNSISVSPGTTTSYTVQYTLNGCTSSTETSTVTVTPTPTVSTTGTTICNGDTAPITATPSSGGGSYSWTPGGGSTQTINVSPSTTTDYSVTYTLSGCTSAPQIATVVVNPTYSLNEAISACNGETVTYPDGASETITGNTMHTSALTSSLGCDSTIVSTVTMNPTYSMSESENICSGSDYTYPDGTTSLNVTANESHTSTLASSAGCDSTIVTSLTVVTAINTTQSANVCEGDSYTYPDGTVSTNITVNESHTSTLPSSAGCDSIIVSSLTVISAINTTQSANVCEGDSYTYPDGTISTNITVNESHVSYLTSTAGCDSIITSSVTVNPIPTVMVNNETICEGESAVLLATPSTTGGDYSWSPGGETTNSIVVSPSATTNYSIVYTLNGCPSSMVSATVTVNPMPDASVTQTDNVLSSNQTGASYQWIDCATGNPISGETGQTFTAINNGSYAVQVDLNGCLDTSACATINTISLSDLLSTSGIAIYPNPVQDLLTVDVPSTLEHVNYTIVDVRGRKIMEGSLDAANMINLSSIESGVYSIRFNEGTAGTIQFMKE